MIAVPRPRDTIASTAPSSSASTVTAGPPPARGEALVATSARLSVGPHPRPEESVRTPARRGTAAGIPAPPAPPEGRTGGRVIATEARTGS